MTRYAYHFVFDIILSSVVAPDGPAHVPVHAFEHEFNKLMEYLLRQIPYK